MFCTFTLGANLDALQDAIITQAELLDIKSDYDGKVEARIIESLTDPAKGKLATLLIQRGIADAEYSHFVASRA